MRVSEAGLALIVRTRDDGTIEYLTQWSDKWGMYSLVGGHVETGETFRVCCVREVAEELDLVPGIDFAVAAEPVTPLQEYVAISGAAKVETLYRVELYAVTLLPEAVAKVSADPANRWLAVSEIATLMTADGKPISAQVRTVLTLFGARLDPYKPSSVQSFDLPPRSDPE